MFTPIRTMPQLKEAIMTTYLYDMLIGLVFIVLLIIIANMISWSGGKVETSGKTRRVWYWILAFVTLLSCVAFNFFAFYRQIGVPSFKMDYMMHMILGGVVATVLYLGLLYILIITQKTKSKLGSIFAKQ